jgi:hypothetical protein
MSPEFPVEPGATGQGQLAEVQLVALKRPARHISANLAGRTAIWN